MRWVPFDGSDEAWERCADVVNRAVPTERTSGRSYRWMNLSFEEGTEVERAFGQAGQKDIAVVRFGDDPFAPAPGKRYFKVHVDAQDDVVGWTRAAFQHATSNMSATKWVTNVRSTDLDELSTLRELGFQIEMEQPVTLLELSSFEPNAWTPHIDRSRAAGYAFLRGSEIVEAGETSLRRFYRLQADLLADVPSLDPIEVIPYDRWVGAVHNKEAWNQEAAVVATFQGEMVGSSELWMEPAMPERGFTGLTGVRAQHRRKGLATAMKAMVLRTAQEQGMRDVKTDNEKNNPMLDLNIRLGFREAYVELILVTAG